MNNYNINYWSKNNFIIDNDLLKINHLSTPSLLEIVETLREDGLRGPMLLRFPHLIQKQIHTLYSSFENSISTFNYKGKFNAIFPLKVNQHSSFITPLKDISKEYNYGLEAGSKSELIIALAKTNLGSNITINGFKDAEMIELAFIGVKMGHNITIIIEGLNELNTIIKISKNFDTPFPYIGIRVRLHSIGSGTWAKSGGINSKFGLTTTEILKAIKIIQEHKIDDRFNMLHFHIGSQISNILAIKKALREVGNIYAELKNLGASYLHAINIGGGLAVDYSISKSDTRNYTIEEFSNDVIFSLKEISEAKGVKEPDIFTESGRFIAAYHSVLIAPVLELFSDANELESLNLRTENPPLIDELVDLLKSMNRSTAREYLHDSIDHMESLLTLFDLGYITLQDRSNTEILVDLIIKKAILFLKDENYKELIGIKNQIQEKYLVNFSLFQSLPDFWGLKQNFPIMPIHHLNKKAARLASIWDITCDSDGEISFNIDEPLFLHDIDIKKQNYFLGFFLSGAYQETLGMNHNLFTHPSEATIVIDKNSYKIDTIIESKDILKILSDINYDSNEIISLLNKLIQESQLISNKEKNDILARLHIHINENGYLRTIENE